MVSMFPCRPEDVTEAWLSAALGGQVDQFEIERFGEGVGIIGQVVRLKLGSSTLPFDSLVAKFPSPSQANRAVAGSYDMYGREVAFYRNIASQIPVRTPVCYHAEFDQATQDFVLLIEDLRDFDVGDQVAGCSVEQARTVVSAIAALHASTWQPRDRFSLISHNNPAQCNGMIAGFEMGWPVVLERFRELVPEAALIAGEKMAAATPRLLQEMSTPPVCLSHADVRLDNVFFGASEIALVDWQSVCTSAPEQDLAYFLTQNVPIDVVREHDLEGLYLDELCAHGVACPRADFERRYRLCALYLLNYAVIIAGTLDLGNARGEALGRTLLGRCFASLDEMGAFALLQ